MTVSRRKLATWAALALAFAWILDVKLRRDAAWTFARDYADAHACRYKRGIPYRLECP